MGLLDRIYQNKLGRAADASGKAYWQKQLDTGALSESQVREAIHNSAEGKQYRHSTGYKQAETHHTNNTTPTALASDGSHQTAIENLYRTKAGRESDAAGMDYWKGIADQHGMDAVTRAFDNTAEAKGYASYRKPSQPQALQPSSTGPTMRSVNAETDTVQGQLKGLLDKENPLMQRGYYKGLDQANSRGLLNSTMGGEAAQAAMMDVAMPIAQQDAATYFDQGKLNQSYDNQFALNALNRQHDISMANLNTNNSIKKTGYDVTANTQGAYLSSIDRIVNNHTVSINQIETATNMTQETKDAMIQNAIQRRDADLAWTRQLYSNMPTWDMSWINLERMPAAPGL